MVVKGRNRDTAWFSITDGEWPVRRAAFEAWLSPENFDENGRQRHSLAAFRGRRGRRARRGTERREGPLSSGPYGAWIPRGSAAAGRRSAVQALVARA